MQEIWCFYKLLEVLMGIACLTFHALGFMKTEPLPHNLFYCGTFSSFTLYSLFGMINICYGRGRSELMEAIPATLGALMHFSASILSMYYAENDFHLMFLTDLEEPFHPFFFYCKAQSIAALTTGGMYMLHATFAFDAVFIKAGPEKTVDESESVSTEGQSVTVVEEGGEVEEEGEMVPLHRRRIELFVLGSWIHNKLMRFKWFEEMSAKP